MQCTVPVYYFVLFIFVNDMHQVMKLCIYAEHEKQTDGSIIAFFLFIFFLVKNITYMYML